MLLAVVDNSLHREDELRLNLRKPVQDTLKMRRWVIGDYTRRREDAIINAERYSLSPAPAAKTGSPYKLQPHLGSGSHSKEGCRLKRMSQNNKGPPPLAEGPHCTYHSLPRTYAVCLLEGRKVL